jgi:hypothetical protein
MCCIGGIITGKNAKNLWVILGLFLAQIGILLICLN